MKAEKAPRSVILNQNMVGNMTDPILAFEAELLAERTADIVSAYVSHHVVPVADLSRLISEVRAALNSTLAPVFPAVALEKQRPAVSVRKSLQDDHLICLDCGNSFRSLKRHLMTHHNMAPDEYRSKWQLPTDYPMVAPDYAQARSLLAKGMGLGRVRKKNRKSLKSAA